MKTKSSILAITAFSALMAVSQSTSAAVLAGWDFDPLPGGAANYGPSPYTSTTTAVNTTNTGLVRGSGIGTLTGSGAANAWGGNAFNIVTPSFASAVAADEFAAVGLTASAGFTVSFSSISAYNVRRSNTGPTTGQWQYAVGTGIFTDIGAPITWGTVTGAAGNPQASISLSGITALQNVPGGTPVAFRVVTWGATAAGGTWYLNDPVGQPGDDFIINGTVIPEPSTALLGGLGLLALFRRRR